MQLYMGVSASLLYGLAALVCAESRTGCLLRKVARQHAMASAGGFESSLMPSRTISAAMIAFVDAIAVRGRRVLSVDVGRSDTNIQADFQMDGWMDGWWPHNAM